MANETLIARLEQSLRQSRGARTRLSARLAEIEAEAEIIRAELIEMDTLAGQTEAAIFRLLSNVMSGPSTQVGTTSVGELEIELQRRLAQAELSQHPLPQQRHNVPVMRGDTEATSDRFFDRTIPQAAPCYPYQGCLLLQRRLFHLRCPCASGVVVGVGTTRSGERRPGRILMRRKCK